MFLFFLFRFVIRMFQLKSSALSHAWREVVSWCVIPFTHYNLLMGRLWMGWGREAGAAANCGFATMLFRLHAKTCRFQFNNYY